MSQDAKLPAERESRESEIRESQRESERVTHTERERRAPRWGGSTKGLRPFHRQGPQG